MKYLIWSYEHNAWWGPARHGYTIDIEQAGRYTAVEAGQIVTSSVLLEEVAMCEPIAVEHGPPSYHPYDGETGA